MFLNLKIVQNLIEKIKKSRSFELKILNLFLIIFKNWKSNFRTPRHEFSCRVLNCTVFRLKCLQFFKSQKSFLNFSSFLVWNKPLFFNIFKFWPSSSVKQAIESVKVTRFLQESNEITSDTFDFKKILPLTLKFPENAETWII